MRTNPEEYTTRYKIMCAVNKDTTNPYAVDIESTDRFLNKHPVIRHRVEHLQNYEHLHTFAFNDMHHAEQISKKRFYDICFNHAEIVFAIALLMFIVGWFALYTLPTITIAL